MGKRLGITAPEAFDPIPLKRLVEAKKRPAGCSPARWRMVQSMKHASRLGLVCDAVKSTKFTW